MDRVTLRRTILSLLVAGLLANWLLILVAFNGYIQFLGLLLSPDGIIDHPNRVILEINIALGSAIVLCFLVTSRASAALLSHTSLTNKIAYCTILIIFCLYQFPKIYASFLFTEDGVFESLTAVFALTTAILLFVKFIADRMRPGWLPMIFLSVLFFLFGMEEISWGQRLFGWDTPEEWAMINEQQEINLHNTLFIHKYLGFLYPPFNLLLGTLILFTTGSGSRSSIPWVKRYEHLYPSREFRLYGYIFLAISLHSFYFDGELTEEIFSILGLTYALEQWRKPADGRKITG